MGEGDGKISKVIEFTKKLIVFSAIGIGFIYISLLIALSIPHIIGFIIS